MPLNRCRMVTFAACASAATIGKASTVAKNTVLKCIFIGISILLRRQYGNDTAATLTHAKCPQPDWLAITDDMPPSVHFCANLHHRAVEIVAAADRGRIEHAGLRIARGRRHGGHAVLL